MGHLPPPQTRALPDSGGLLLAHPRALEMVKGEEPPGRGRQGLARRTQERKSKLRVCSLSAAGSPGPRQDSSGGSPFPLLPFITGSAGGDKGDYPPTSQQQSASPAQLYKPTFLLVVPLPKEDPQEKKQTVVPNLCLGHGWVFGGHLSLL